MLPLGAQGSHPQAAFEVEKTDGLTFLIENTVDGFSVDTSMGYFSLEVSDFYSVPRHDVGRPFSGCLRFLRHGNRHDEHDGNRGPQQGQRNEFHLLPFGCAVDDRALIKALVDAGDGGHVHDHGVTEGLPGVHEHEDEGPILLILIPHDALTAEVVELISTLKAAE